MLLVDLFCGEGGAAMGLHRVWPDAKIVGIDINAQPRYPFTFIQGDAVSMLTNFSRASNMFDEDEPDFIWASPPCKRFTSLNNRFSHKFKTQPEEAHPDFITPIRKLLKHYNVPYVIENVVGAPLINPVTLCGSMFGLGITGRGYLRRHRLFESNFLVEQPKCDHKNKGRALGVSGHGAKNWEGGGIMLEADAARQILEVPWMSRDGTAQAIPPAYSEYIAKQYNYSATSAGSSSLTPVSTSSSDSTPNSFSIFD